MEKERFIYWDEYLSLCRDLAESIMQYLNHEQREGYLYGVPRGGMIAANIISHQLEKLKAIAPSTPFNCAKSVLATSGVLFMGTETDSEKILFIIDDIFDTGETINDLLNRLKRVLGKGSDQYKYRIIPCALIERVTCQVDLASLNAKTIYSKDWVVFPYEVLK